jgi:hypothetical protein
MLNICEYFNNLAEKDFDAYVDQINEFSNLYENCMNDDESDGSEVDEWAVDHGIDLNAWNDKVNESYLTLWLWDYLDN